MFELPISAQYNFPTTIRFGAGIRKELPDAIKSRGFYRPLLVTDRILAELPIVQEIFSSLKTAGLSAGLFSGVQGNPVKSQVLKGVESFHSINADSIIAVGGGAAIDVAKAILLMAHHPGDLFDYEDGKPDGRPVDKTIPFFIAIPTTAGTGSEAGRSTVISDDATHVKKIIFSPRLLASIVFVDPELTLELPPAVTASTGMDALTHLMESYLALGFQPLCDGIALEGIRLAAKSLVPCVEFAKKKGDRTAEHVYHRGMMLNAALMGAVAFQKGLGVNHSCAHALSTVCDMHHGLANGIMLPYSMRFNLEAAPEKFQIMSNIIGETEGKGAVKRDYIIDWIFELQKKTGIPAKLTAAGVKKEQIDALVGVAVKDACHPSNPRKVTQKDFQSLFTEAMG